MVGKPDERRGKSRASRLCSEPRLQLQSLITEFMISEDPVAYIVQPPRLLDQLREILRCKYYSLRTKDNYVYWVRFLRRGSIAKARFRSVFRVFLASSPYETCAKRYKKKSNLTHQSSPSAA